MKRRSNKPLRLAALAVTGVLAAVPLSSAAMNTMTGPLPPERTQGSVTYMSGGIGHEEAMAMREEERRFPLSLEFIRRAKPTDEFLANVEVTIKDRQGNTAFAALANGPYLLTDVPDGKYTVSADFNGQTKTRNVVVAAHKPERVVFEW